MPGRRSNTRASYARTFTAVATLALAIAGGARAQMDDDADAPKNAHVLAHKSVVDALCVEGQNMTIKIALHNAGGTAARKVKVVDEGFDSENFELITGSESLTANFETLVPGASESYSFVVVPKTSGSFYGGAASVQYLGSSGREVTHGKSNVVDAIPVYTTTQKNIFTALKVGKYVTLGACKTMEDWLKYGTIIGTVVGVLALNWLALKVKKGVAAMRRRYAVAALSKQD
jgi:translocon-associated protein subunit beta|uniref:Translocon-associated protein subunit beta n=1 Tax=Ostreococcus mediterraneus TaxID=1486918 RepID=A0A7S0WEB9_9CHLO|mmetsp:Transcript_1961/g.7314  ORF Transcript_1961/g.7314 Transcript_1961/m.7314 type:complete len:231 (-) Transcript_1961:65-757(-)